MRRIASIWIWICHLICISVKFNTLPLLLWLPNCHSCANSDNTVKIQIYCTQNIYMMIIWVCLSACNFLTSASWQIMHVPSFCLLMHQCIQNHSITGGRCTTVYKSFSDFPFQPSSLFFFSSKILEPNHCCHDLMFFLYIRKSKLIMWVIRDPLLCRGWIKWFWASLCHAASLLAVPS